MDKPFPLEGMHQAILEQLAEGVYVVDKDRRILFWNRAAQQISGYKPEQVLGRCCWDNILGHADEVGTPLCATGCPLQGTMDDGCPRTAQIFLHHAEGHRVPVTVRAAPLYDKDGKLMGAVEVFTEAFERVATEERIQQLEQLSYIDQLTGLGNRRLAENALESRLSELQRYGWPFGVLMLDVDHFKQVNDHYGHEVGDQILGMVGKTLQHARRPHDVHARWGGEEFLAIVANADREALTSAANRLRVLVQTSTLPLPGQPKPLRVTISVGGTLARTEDGLTELYQRADRALYASKEGGRNKVTILV